MILLGTIQAQRAVFRASWSGAWTLDVDAVLDDTGIAPTGPTTVVIGTTPLVGTIDPDASGAFGPIYRARVVAGGGGWSKDVGRQGYHNDAGVFSTLVRAETAAEVGEVVVEAVPELLGVDYGRAPGMASAVLPRDGWFVDLTGITIAGPRIPVPADPLDVTLISWDPLTQVADLASSTIIVPGTIILDAQLGTTMVRSIEQTFDETGSRSVAMCSPVASSGTSKLSAALARFVREAAGIAHARSYEYRVVAQSPIDGRVIVQSVNGDAADMGPLEIWPGAPGVTAKLVPGSLVILEFVGGDPSAPIVRSFDATVPPLELDLTATAVIKLTAPAITVVGAIAATSIAVAGGVRPLPAAAPINAALSAIKTALATIAAATTPPTTAAATAAGLAIDAATNAPPTQVLG